MSREKHTRSSLSVRLHDSPMRRAGKKRLTSHVGTVRIMILHSPPANVSAPGVEAIEREGYTVQLASFEASAIDGITNESISGAVISYAGALTSRRMVVSLSRQTLLYRPKAFDAS